MYIYRFHLSFSLISPPLLFILALIYYLSVCFDILVTSLFKYYCITSAPIISIRQVVAIEICFTLCNQWCELCTYTDSREQRALLIGLALCLT